MTINKIVNGNGVTIRGFSTSEALDAFCADLLSGRDTARWVLKKLNPSGVSCPACNLGQICDAGTNPLKKFRCPSCGKWFTAISGTILNNAHFNMKEAFLIAVLIEMEVDDKTIAKILGIKMMTVRAWKQKFQIYNERHNA